MEARLIHLVSAFQRFKSIWHRNKPRSGTNYTLYLSLITTTGEIYHIQKIIRSTPFKYSMSYHQCINTEGVGMYAEFYYKR